MNSLENLQIKSLCLDLIGEGLVQDSFTSSWHLKRLPLNFLV